MRRIAKFITIGTLFTIFMFPFTTEQTSIQVNAQEINGFNYTAGVNRAINETVVLDQQMVSLNVNDNPITTSPIETDIVLEETILEEIVETEEELFVPFTYDELNKTMYAKTTINVRDLPNIDGNKIGKLSFAQEIKITGQCKETKWYKIDYNGSTAYISNEYVSDTKPEPPKTKKPKNYNPPSGGSGQDIVNYAVQFVGNPYVWGGTSLTNGADCSGFVQSVYKAFGVNLPRTSYKQRTAGYAVSESDRQPGDIICYSGHVAIYIGNNKIVHASNAKEGIKISTYNYRSIITIRRIY